MSFIEINEILINLDNVCYIDWDSTQTDGYIWKETWRLYIYFIGDEVHGRYCELKTYDYQEFKSWLDLIRSKGAKDEIH